MNLDSKIFVAGHRGLVGSAIYRTLSKEGYKNILTASKAMLDLRNHQEVVTFFQIHKPEYVFLAAAKVGGIMANSTMPASFIYDNLMIQTNVIDSAYRFGCKKLVFLGSSCIYPKEASVPIEEKSLLSGPLEKTNEAYAIAKIAGINMCQSYRKQYGFDAIALMPCNLYGPNDNFDLETSHVLPALINKFHTAKMKKQSEVVCWGDGSPMREFLFVDDLAKATLHCMRKYSSEEIINVGTGEDITIRELVTTVANVVGYNGNIVWDTSKPNGTMRKVMNVDKIKQLGWQPETDLETGIRVSYDWFIKNVD